MRPITIEILFRNTSPVAHHSGTEGNLSILMRQEAILPDGSIASIPYITGDSLRHGLREGAADVMLEAIGDPPLPESAIRLLYSGGIITGKGRVIKLDEFRDLSMLLPMLPVFGGCCDNRTVPGRLRVDDALPVCLETAHRVPEWVRDQATLSADDLVEKKTRFRMDPSNSPRRRAQMSDVDREAAEERLSRSERASAEGDAAAREETKSTMMPRSYEAIKPGALFSWAVHLDVVVEADLQCLGSAIAAWATQGRVGGKQGTGCGRVEVVEAKSIELGTIRRQVEEWSIPGEEELGRYLDHLAEKSDDIAAALDQIDA